MELGARPDPPAHLGSAGVRAWEAAHAKLDADVQFTAKEFELLLLVCGQSDLVDRLELELAATESLARSTLPSKLSTARTALARLWTEIGSEPDVEGAPAVVNRRAQRAARARWGRARDLEIERGA